MRLSKPLKRQAQMSVNYSYESSYKDLLNEKGESSEKNEGGTFFGSERPLMAIEEAEKASQE